MLLFTFKNRTICTDSDDIFRFLVYIYIALGWWERCGWCIAEHFECAIFPPWWIFLLIIDLFFSEASLKSPQTKGLEFFCKTDKKLVMERTFLFEKASVRERNQSSSLYLFFEKKFKFLSQGFFLHHMTQLLGA